MAATGQVIEARACESIREAARSAAPVSDETPNPGGPTPRTLDPELHAGTFVFVSKPQDLSLDEVSPVGMFVEDEGVTLILSEEEAARHRLDVCFRAAWITLRVNSSLTDVGLTAAFSRALAEDGISCNVYAALHHDHIFVPVADGHRALQCLDALAEKLRLEGTCSPIRFTNAASS